ncbi:DUF4365 domain-containing protein [Bradyrhizobium sp. JYMT SZCCT0428]|uniref:DUF4365 domain-containing protein n=1 Tax=Bradyrhizobium sp. JYMT SZCCT0428 TaxID=2807673 RepID=UPI001BA8652E|nr:DUF4365 domain-containing protein [Bradyrhizobium sp. JYMT SZCCT0428]MBR1149764.1 DUF4365 domain-containing protein [Bradyrhizobium sp. JYMT SZCCT0428]
MNFKKCYQQGSQGLGMPTVPPYAAISHRQEAFSGVYIRAVCAVTGCAIEVPSIDHDKIDYSVRSRVVGSIRSKPQIDIQAKCQMSGVASNDPVSYSLDLETYDNLRDPMVSNPRILVLVLVPSNVNEWMDQSEKTLVMSHCAYWVSLKGAPSSSNATSQTVHFPRKNVFNPTALQTMMSNTSNGLDL